MVSEWPRSSNSSSRVGAVHVEHQAVRVGTRSYDEVVLEISIVAVVHDVDAGIDLREANGRESGNIGAPCRWIVPHEVVRDARKRVHPRDAGVGVRPRKSKSHNAIGVRRGGSDLARVGRNAPSNDGFGRSEEGGSSPDSSEEADVAVRLSDVRLESDVGTPKLDTGTVDSRGGAPLELGDSVSSDETRLNSGMRSRLDHRAQRPDGERSSDEGAKHGRRHGVLLGFRIRGRRLTETPIHS